MGIGINVARICAYAVARRPLKRALLLGRQTMFFSPEAALPMIRACGIEPSEQATGSIEIDFDTVGSSEGRYIRDDSYLRLLGCEEVHCLDVSDYERADLIWDLNKPVPAEFHSRYDLILDGSVLDNVFNPAEALINSGRMLAPGGILVAVNMGSNHQTPYSVETPSWYYDYFVVNPFAACRVYVNVIDRRGGYNCFALNPDRLKTKQLIYNLVAGDRQLSIVCVAEKGPQSTSEVIPVQQQYRSDDYWRDYISAVSAIKQLPNDDFSSVPRFFFRAPAGYDFITSSPMPTSAMYHVRRNYHQARMFARTMVHKILRRLPERHAKSIKSLIRQFAENVDVG